MKEDAEHQEKLGPHDELPVGMSTSCQAIQQSMSCLRGFALTESVSYQVKEHLAKEQHSSSHQERDPAVILMLFGNR